MTRWRSSAGAWLRRTRSSRSLGTSRPSAPARRQIESLIAEGFAAHSSSSSTATSMSLSRPAVPRARLPCSQARRTEESPPRACARRSLRLPTSLSPPDTVTSISRSDPLSVSSRDRGQPRISIARASRKGIRAAVVRICPEHPRRHANRTLGTSMVGDTSWSSDEFGLLGRALAPSDVRTRPRR